MRILTGIDLTMEDHDWILKPSIQIAGKLNAQIDLIYVMAGAETSKVAHNLSQLQDLLATLPKQNQGQVICEPGTVVSGLVDRADKYDMIVIGPREPGPLERILRGPVAARVVQRTSKPVLIPRLEHKPYRKRCKLLVGIDLQGPDHQRLLRLAGDWAKHTSGTVDGVYVEPNRLPYISDSRVRAAAERDWEAARQPIRLQLQEMMAQVVEEPHRGEARCLRGHCPLRMLQQGPDALQPKRVQGCRVPPLGLLEAPEVPEDILPSGRHRAAVHQVAQQLLHASPPSVVSPGYPGVCSRNCSRIRSALS